MTALARAQPDRVPWMENDFEEGLQVRIMGTRDYTPGDLCRRLGMDAFGYHYPSGGAAVAGQLLQSKEDMKSQYYYPTRITFDFVPPWIAEMGTDSDTGRTYIKKGLLVSEEALSLFDTFLPDPHHPARYERVQGWIAKYKEDFAVFARIRFGVASAIESMGLETISYAIYDNPGLVKCVVERFASWSAAVVEHLNQMDFDFYWVNDDIADNHGPWFSPQVFREFFLPYMRQVARVMKKPWIYHSDGNLMPLMEDLLTLGMAGVHPIQPAAMEIGEVKRQYGHRVCLVGNIDLDYILTRASPEEVEANVRDTIRVAGPGGGYIISSANSLTDYCQVKNVLAFSRAVAKYGRYPLVGHEAGDDGQVSEYRGER